jgi:hypothetical protein
MTMPTPTLTPPCTQTHTIGLDGDDADADSDDAYGAGADDLFAVAEQIAEMALLGGGAGSLLFPTTLDEYEVAMAEEMPSRVAL